MTFQEWFNEIEGFSLRMERAYDDLVKDPKDPQHFLSNSVSY